MVSIGSLEKCRFRFTNVCVKSWKCAIFVLNAVCNQKPWHSFAKNDKIFKSSWDLCFGGQKWASSFYYGRCFEMGGIDQIDMVSMLPSLILIKNEGFWMIWDGFELFGVDCERKFFRGFFMIFVSHKIFFLILFFKAEVWIFLSIMVYFDVDFEIYTFTFACGVVFSNGTCELAGKTTIYRKVFWMGKIFFQQNE